MMSRWKWIALAAIMALALSACATDDDLNRVEDKVDTLATSVADLVEKFGSTSEPPTETTSPPEETTAPPAETTAPPEGDGGDENGPDSDGVPSGDATMVFRNTKTSEGMDLPDNISRPDPSRQEVFPDVPHKGRPALVAYESPFEDGDFCDSLPCNVDISQFYYRVMTAGRVTIPGLDVDCVASDTRGCLVVVINWFGETAMYRHALIDHGFTIAGRVWDMSTPNKVTLAGQALLDHYAGRMTASQDGANCGTIEACNSTEWHLVVIGNGAVQGHWSGVYSA